MAGPDLGLISVREAAEALGVGITTYYERVRPHVPVVRIGSRVLMRRTDLAAFVESSVRTGGVQNAPAKRAPRP